MAEYSIFAESRRILNEVLLSDGRLGLPSSFAEAASKVTFVGNDDKPFILTPLKITESCAALTGLVATAANVVAAERYGRDYENVTVDVDAGTLFLESVLLPTIGGKHFLQHPQMTKELDAMDIHHMSKNIRRYATNVYQTKDGRWYHLHGSMNAAPTMAMLGVADVEVSAEEAFKIYAEKVREWDSQEIDKTANEVHHQAGVVCYTPEEFFTSKHGKVMAQEPLWTRRSVTAPRKAWPVVEEGNSRQRSKPLAGIRILDVSRVIAAPAVSKLLAALGADVLRISCDKLPEYAATMPDLQTGKRDANLDLKTVEGKRVFAELVKDADILVDGYRPGALARLGFDSLSLRQHNPSLIYMRENCYGFKGPLAYRSGWQQISDCLVGLSYLQGQFLGLDEAVVPLLPNSDYQTGLVGAAAAIHALLDRTTKEETYDIDISLTQYNIWYYQLGLYDEEQQRALRARDPEFSPRHFDDMNVLVAKTHKSMQKVRPDIFTHDEYFVNMSGAEYGLDEPIRLLAPTFKIEGLDVGWDVPTGRRGRSKPEWVA